MSFDLSISQFVHNNLSNPFLDRFFILITSLGNFGWFWIAFSIILLLIKKTRPIGIVCVIALICDALCVDLIKALIQRLRPFQVYSFELLIKPPSGYSFPSAHSSIAFTCATTYFLMGKEKPNRTIRWFILVLAFLIAFSRLYLLVHFFTDILVGALLGVLIGFLSVCFWKRYLSKKVNLS